MLTVVQHGSQKLPWDIFNSFRSRGRFRICQFPIPEIPAEKYADFEQLCDAIRNTSLNEFVEKVLPDYVSNLRSIGKFLSSTYKDKGSQAVQLLLLHETPISLACDETYQAYLEVAELRKVSKRLSRKQFTMIYAALGGYALSYKTSLDAGGLSAAKKLEEEFLSQEERLLIVAGIKEFLPDKARTGINYPVSYLSKCIHGQSDALKTQNLQSAIKQVLNVVTDKLALYKFVEAMLNSDGDRYNQAECDFIALWFKDHIGLSEKMLIVNASMAFMETWAYRHYPKAVFSHQLFDRIVGIDPNKLAVNQIEAELGQEILDCSLDQSGTYNFDKVLYFARGAKKERVENDLIHLCSNVNVIVAVLPDTYKGTLTKIHEKGYGVEEICILPKDIFQSTPSKMFTAKICRGDYRTIRAYEFKSQESFVYLQSVQTSYISLEDFYSKRSLRTLYKEAKLANASARARKAPQGYKFSDELTVWYRLSKINGGSDLKLVAYLCDPATPVQERRNKLPRGKKIKNSEVRVQIPKDENVDSFIRRWIEKTAVYKRQIYATAKGQIINKAKKAQSISFKGLWYCYGDRTDAAEKWQEIVHQLSLSDFGKLVIGGGVTADNIERSLNCFLPEEFKGNDEKIWDIFDQLFEKAAREKLIPYNPVIERVKQRMNENAVLRGLRNLKQKTLTWENEDKTVCFLMDRFPDRIAVGTLIRLFTGLTPAQVAALTWGDFRQIGKSKDYQLQVYKRISNKGELVFESRGEKDRVIPIMCCLGIILEEYKRISFNGRPIKKKELDSYRIISDPNKTAQNDVDQIRKLTRTMIEKLNLPENTIPLHGVAGKLEMDLNDYDGDMLRKNFEMRIRTECRFSRKYIRWLTLSAMPTTISKNYTDFEKDVIQQRTAQKLNIWGTRYEAYICRRLGISYNQAEQKSPMLSAELSPDL